MKNKKPLILLILLIHLILLLNLRFTAWPEMILWPYFVLKGLLPYRDFAVAHTPALIFDLSIFYKIFGLSLLSLKIYTWILILLTGLLTYWLSEKLTKNKKIALLSLAFYALWQPYFEGNGAWFDLALAPVALLIFYLLWQKDYFWSGVLFALAILVKQTAFWFLFPISFTFWLFKQLKTQKLVKFAAGLAIPLLVFLFYLIKTGVWRDFYFWAIRFGIGYLPHAPGQSQLPTFKQFLALGIPYGMIFPAILTLLRSNKLCLLLCRNKVRPEKRILPLFLIWCFFASLGFYPRWGYFHFQPALPFLAIISGVVISYINISYKKLNWLIFYLILVFLGTAYLQVRFYRLNWQKPDRFFEKEAMEIASWLKLNTKPGEKIFILNSWDHLYALSETLPAVSPWVPTLPWYMEYPEIQEEIVADLEQEKPNLVVFEPYKEKGLGSYKPEKIDKFLQANYTTREIVAGRFWILQPK